MKDCGMTDRHQSPPSSCKEWEAAGPCTALWLNCLLSPFFPSTHASSLTTSLPFKLSDLGNFHFSISLPFLSSQNISRLQYFTTTLLRGLGWPGHACRMAPLLPPWLWATPLACSVSFQIGQLWDPSKPQLLTIHSTFIRVSPRSTGAALGPSGLSINAFTIFRSTSCFSFENPALASSDSNTISDLHAPLVLLPRSPRLFSFFGTTSPYGNILLILLSLSYLVF